MELAAGRLNQTSASLPPANWAGGLQWNDDQL